MGAFKWVLSSGCFQPRASSHRGPYLDLVDTEAHEDGEADVGGNLTVNSCEASNNFMWLYDHAYVISLVNSTQVIIFDASQPCLTVLRAEEHHAEVDGGQELVQLRAAHDVLLILLVWLGRRRVVGVQAQKLGFKLKALCALSVSRIESRSLSS